MFLETVCFQVGLKSEIIQSQFRLEPGGHLQLVRRCNGHTCHGHCVCAAQDRKCAIDSKIGSCVDKTGGMGIFIL